MDLLEKFDGVEITTDNAIPQADREWCETRFNFYTTVFKAYENHIKTMLELESMKAELDEVQTGNFRNYVDGIRGISARETEQSIAKLNSKFADDICDYFSEKYFLPITSDPLELELEKELRYITLDEIFEKCILSHLDGFSFKEKAIEEMKQRAKADIWDYEINGKIIKFKIGMSGIYPALCFFDNGETEIVEHFTHNKVEDNREFVNGNTDIKFAKAEYAMDFARRFLGYDRL